MTNDEIIKEWDNSPYIAEDDICQHQGEEYHAHNTYKGKTRLPYYEQRKNRELRIIKNMLNEARSEAIADFCKELDEIKCYDLMSDGKRVVHRYIECPNYLVLKQKHRIKER